MLNRLFLSGAFFGALFFVSLAVPSERRAQAQTPPPDAAQIQIAYVNAAQERPLPISRLNIVPGDAGLRGAELAVSDNNTTGRFTKQHFTLKQYELPKAGDAGPLIERILQDGIGLILVSANAETLLALSNAAQGKPVLLFNLDAEENSLRQEDCRANIVHITPSQAMLTDALTQFLVLKQWTRWFLVTGANQTDKTYSEAIRKSAQKFGAQIVEEKLYAHTDAAARTDSGHAQVQKQMASFTQISADYDIIVVADESEIFGPYMAYRSWSPRPVAGTSGAAAMSWHPAHEQWGATQMQNRFFELAGRVMQPLDFHGWLAARAIGEAATRSASGDFAAIRDYLLGPDFGVAAFKGQKVSFRPWNQQMRQPIAIATTEMPISWSPQPGFLHQRAEVDTLGIDEPESKCELR
ncbi:MAG: ABC transporter substrate-binding protein [Hyphomicrobiales bacterium]|nr:ABC transporter substrate-binding protein [Hyphomicrobiales bacterium]